MNIRSRILALLIILHILFSLETLSQAPKVLDASELKLAMNRLSVLGSVLYVGAHPDDENTALLAYLAKGKLVRTAYLSMTRGEGGQNLIGPELGDELGAIRTQELLAARRVDGAEQFFSRAIDFGYSKTSKETMNMWGDEKMLSDVVWIIRNFRPDVIITRFSPTIGGHGNHTSSAILAEQAFEASGDANRFPDQLKYVEPWKAKRLMFNTARFFDASFDTTNAVKLDVGEYNQILGRSYSEIAGISRTNHKSQGFGASQTRGPGINYFRNTLGDPATTSPLDGIDLSWSRVPGGGTVDSLLKAVDNNFDIEHTSAGLPLLLKARSAMIKLQDGYWVDLKRKEIEEVIKAAAGLWIDALASEYSVVPGNQITLSIDALNRSDAAIRIDSVSVPNSAGSIRPQLLISNVPVQSSLTVDVPLDAPYSVQYWLQQQPDKGSYNIPHQQLIGRAENAPAISATFYLTIGGQQLSYVVPVQYRWVDPVDGELYRPLVVIPPAAINLEEKVIVFTGETEKEISLTVKSGMPNVSGSVRLVLPDGWSSNPTSSQFELKAMNDEKVVRLAVRPSNAARSGEFSVEANVAGKILDRGRITIQYKHIPPQVIFPLAHGKLVRTDLSMSGKTVGYIMGAGDEVPTALRQMGYQVTLLTDDDLANRDFSRVDVVIAGIRAYNTRPALRMYQNRLMDYVKKGGTYIVQYVTLQRSESDNLGPYPFNVSRDRVTVEEAPPVFLNPHHALLNYPNKITAEDFDGWVQERGLYFADRWDAHYDTVIGFADPGESLKSGGLLYAKYGKGNYIYTGFDFFRELPAGVPGAYRLFSNMLSVGKETKLKRMLGVEGAKGK
jgi:LmbE family N-acetylglucosaminyl deacetylase